MDSSVKAENVYRMAMPFTLAEYRSRVAKVKEEMARQKIDLLYCSAPESLFYLSGYESYWYKAQCPREWPPLSGMAISQIIQAALEKEGCSVVDGSDIVREIRVIKSPQEMAYTRTAARIADIGMKAAVEHIKPGMTELDLRAEVDYACAKAGGETPGLPTLVRGGSQPHVGGHVETSRRAIMPGIVVVDLCGVYHRYHADLARTLSLGEPDTDVAKRMDLSAKAWSVAIEEDSVEILSKIPRDLIVVEA